MTIDLSLAGVALALTLANWQTTGAILAHPLKARSGPAKAVTIKREILTILQR